MANPEHVKILKDGVKGWNEWRLNNSSVIPDFNEADFREAYMTAANLRGADLSGADLFKAHINEATLTNANLRGADLREADLGAATLQKADLREAKLDGADISGADLRWAIMTKAHLTGVRADGANLQGADLHGAILKWANLRGADLLSADLGDTDLSMADLRGTHLSDANLSLAKLDGTDMRAVDIRDANLDRAQIQWVTLGNVDLSEVKGLETVVHTGPSTMGIDTIYRSKGKIPENFLRGCGIPDDFIVYMHSLVASPIEFYSCFISYSSKDHELAERLHVDLQSKGVRCWFAPEHMKIGDKIRSRIDESIRLYDKLMIILSHDSLESEWVESEVEAAMEKERRERRAVLFPIRLDDSVMDTDKAWAADIRRQRHIGDFREWKNHDSFKKAFERLLRDLKAGEK
jgi:uncharacterized protein YjbI with pentapeptide repeats